MQQTANPGISLDDVVQAFFAALPDPGSNPVGATARSVLVNRVKGATPGRAGTPYIGVQGDRFIDVFFPHYAPVAYQENVTAVTGLDESFFCSLSAAVLCEAMYNLTSELRPQILINKVQNDINGFMGSIINSGKPWYAFLLPRVPSDVLTAYQAIPPEQRAQALAIYRSALTSQAWINAKIVQHQSGSWPNPDWELYHHYIKLLLLGDSDSSVDDLIRQLISRSLPVPQEAAPGNWKNYFRWFTPPISWQDVSGEAASGILKEEYYIFSGSTWPCCLKENYSFEFTASSQPGNRYREAPSSCCFKAGAMVLMADGSLKPIEEIKTGELVMTPAEPKQVALISTPLRANRTLYSFGGINFQFTDTHPFITYESLADESAPTFACMEPMRLINSVPALSSFGVLPLSCDRPPRLCRHGYGGEIPVPVPPVSAHPSGGDVTELLYDLILEPGQSGISEYYAGDLSTQVRVSSEIPRYAECPEVSYALLLMLNGCYKAILDTLGTVPEEDFADVVTVGLSSVDTGMLPAILRELPDGNPQYGLGNENLPGQLEEMVTQMFTLFSQPQSYNLSAPGFNYNPNTRFGNLFNILAATFGIKFIAALDMGWRDMSFIEHQAATMLAVSVYAVELDGTFHLPEQDSLQLLIELSGDQTVYSALLTPAVPGGASPYYHAFDQCAYFNGWRPGIPGKGKPWLLSFQLLQAQSREPVGTKAVMFLLPEMKSGLQSGTALINDEAGRHFGRITFDARPINDLIYQKEQQARISWNPQKKQAMAKLLGEMAGKYTSERFPAAAKLFGQTALVNPQSAFPQLPPP